MAVLSLEKITPNGLKTDQGVYTHIVKLLQPDFDLTGKGVVRLGRYAVASGGFADVWEGSLNGKHVAVKVARPPVLARERRTP